MSKSGLSSKLASMVSLALLLTLTVSWVNAQSVNNDLKLEVHRTFGYGNGDQIQGHFTLVATGLELKSATFLIDTDVIGTTTSAPFQVTMDTDNYPHGFHTLTVTAETTDGQTFTSQPHRYEFVDASVANFDVVRIVGPIFAVVFGIILVSFGIQFLPSLMGKRKTLPLGATRSYGLKGGAICPKCGRPFGLHFMSVNLLTGYYDYCDHCGKWSFVQRATPAQLAAAEQAELKQAVPDSPITPETPEQKLRRQIEDSRYTDK